MKPKNCHVESRTNNHLGTVLYSYSPPVLLESDLIFRYFQSSSSRDKFCNQKRVHMMCPQNHSHSTCCTGCGIPGIGGCHSLSSDPSAANDKRGMCRNHAHIDPTSIEARSQKGIVLPVSLSLNKSMISPHKSTQVYCISRDPHDAAGAGVAIWIELWHGKRKVYWKAMVFIVGTAKMRLSLCVDHWATSGRDNQIYSTIQLVDVLHLELRCFVTNQRQWASNTRVCTQHKAFRSPAS